MENPNVTGLPKLLHDLIFFNIRIATEGLHTGFLLDRRTGTIRVFISPPLFSPVKDRGLMDFPMSVFLGQHKKPPILTQIERFRTVTPV